MEPTVTLSLKDFDSLRFQQKRYKQLLSEIQRIFNETEEYIDETDEHVALLEIDKKKVAEFLCKYSEFAEYSEPNVKVVFIENEKNHHLAE